MASRIFEVRAHAFALAALAVLPALIAGCIDPPPDWGHDSTAEEGAGYRTIVIHPRATFEVVEAALSPDARTLALMFEDGVLQLWGVNGTMLRAWQMEAAPWHCIAERGCGIWFLPNSTLLSFVDSNVTVHSLDGHLLWNWSAPASHQGIRWMEPAENGTLLVLSFNDRTARVRNVLTAEEFPIDDGGHKHGADISSSDTADIVGTAGATVGFFNPAGALVAEFDREGDVEVAGDGRAGFVWRHDHDGAGILSLVHLTVVPGTFENLTVPGAWQDPQFPADQADRLFISAGGRFAAVHARFSVSTCRGDDCDREPHDYVRVLDLANRSRDLGFGAVRPIRIFLAADGSAVAVSSVLAQMNVYRIELTVADAGATPPRLVPPPPIV